MNKSELIDAMAEKAGLTKVQAKNALDAFMCTTGDALKKGDKISLVGFVYIAPPNTFLLPAKEPRSTSTTFLPPLAIVTAQETPAGPAPTTITSTLFTIF